MTLPQSFTLHITNPQGSGYAVSCWLYLDGVLCSRSTVREGCKGDIAGLRTEEATKRPFVFSPLQFTGGHH